MSRLHEAQLPPGDLVHLHGFCDRRDPQQSGGKNDTLSF